jgi:succinate dehydrogenase flavin-adding protein (antitoxin of CptAB toxin-antitoxin module)
MRELDNAMIAYLEHHFDDASTAEKEQFESLLDWQEPELYRLICGKDKDARYQNIIDKISHTLANNTPSV